MCGTGLTSLVELGNTYKSLSDILNKPEIRPSTIRLLKGFYTNDKKLLENSTDEDNNPE